MVVEVESEEGVEHSAKVRTCNTPSSSFFAEPESGSTGDEGSGSRYPDVCEIGAPHALLSLGPG